MAAPIRTPPASAKSLGGTSHAGRVLGHLGPTLDKVIKNAAWRKHSNLVSACRAVLDRVDAITAPISLPLLPIRGLFPSYADTVLHPLALAVDTAYAYVAESGLDCALKLFFLGLIRGEIDYRSDG